MTMVGDRLLDVFGDKPKHKHFRLVKSSGSTAHPIIDLNRKVCALYGSMPNDEGFMADVHDTADHALEEARAMASLSYERLHHRPLPWGLGHSNIPIAAGEHWYSTQYTQGGLFRWVKQEEQWGLKWAAAEAALFLTLEEPKAGA
ncbi:hypothetical protein K438DRAFT_1964237 [Mycena galopus ATCC 62051]|nr:hypothetical protein K438DRAFT_1964237 [Mycena galopus ATCC 62051]